MSKSKQKNRSDLEHLRGYNRELEKEVRSLRKQLKQYEKYERISQDDNDIASSEDTYPEIEFKLTKDCSSCGKDKIVESLEIMGKHYGTCATCGYSERLK